MGTKKPLPAGWALGFYYVPGSADEIHQKSVPQRTETITYVGLYASKVHFYLMDRFPLLRLVNHDTCPQIRYQ
jgi:hypothetical protein